MGAYRDDAGKPYLLKCVLEAEKRIIALNMDHEYAGIDGIPTFREKASALAFGADSELLKSKRIATC